jgi:DNA (cytosine-5)-methyltransferase 1
MLAIDLFCGSGGFSEGSAQAGVEVVWAANHNPLAVKFHTANHPSTDHLCQDLHQADWRTVPAHDIVLASPACQGHSRARGKEKAHHDSQRSTAWAVVSCAEYHRSEALIVENVPEFLDWALYPAWADALKRLGYALAPHIINAANHGVPQERERLFLICTRSKEPLYLNIAPKPHVPISTVIEWDRHRWNPIQTSRRSAKTLERIRNGRKRFGDCFLAPFYSSGSGLTGRSIDRPLGTITTKDRWLLIRGDECRMLQPSELRSGMGFRSDYSIPETRAEAIHLLGNAVCPPVAADLIRRVKQSI